jgi:hypothetical protein
MRGEASVATSNEDHTTMHTTPADRDAPRYRRVAEEARRWNKHPSAIIRYVTSGWTDRKTGETIRPEGAIRTPGEWLIPEGALEEFFARVTAARQSVAAPPSQQATQARQRVLDQVDAELDAVIGV